MEFFLIREIVVIFVTALAGGYIAFRLRQPALVGYLIGGVLLSVPFFSDIIDFEFSRGVAQFGVALLLFATGVEFPISKLLSIKRSIVLGSVIHLALFILLSGLTVSKLGFSLYEGLFLSAAFSNSGTVIILHLLEKGVDFDTRLSQTVISWLIVQDVAMIIIAVLVTTLSGSDTVQTFEILEAIAKSVVFIILGVLLGRNVIPKIFESMTKMGSTELLLIMALVFCVGVAFFAEIIGLSYTLGAFFAGVMISESFVNHAVFSEIKPIRDLFAIIFYVSLGTLLSTSFFFDHIFQILLVLGVLLFIKFILGFIIILVSEKQTRKAFILSLTLVQGGEFSFILAQIGLNNEWISKDFYSLTIIVTILSLLLTSLFMTKGDDWYKVLRSFVRKRSIRLYNLLFIRLDRLTDVDQPDLVNHVVIAGFGRVGSYVGKALEKSGVPYIIVDSGPEVIDYCKQRGIKFVFGDASSLDVLEKADVERAEAVIIALPKEGDAEMVAENSRKLNPSIKLIARSHMPIDNQRLRDKGIAITVEPEFEAAISISKKVLNYFGKPSTDISKYLKKSRRRQRSKVST